ncbi:DedA family protein [Streptomyces tateyamensis]|uniref:DedA family protein n=1 Tax=Streptomyces tateyamensis TaxID=565073 RepID=A0A2V4N0X4_9ACTN|nr:DedA family protein [Streptomyces tateyamensis]
MTSWLQGLPGPLVYAAVGGLVFAEDAIFVGFVLPGETAAVLGGVIAQQGRVDVWWLGTVVVLAAILGDTVGYQVGHRYGDRILTVGPLRRHQQQIDRSKEFIGKRGASAVFLGRFIAFFRAMMPALAGISRMPYRRFLLYNALGGLVWGVGFTALGYFAGAAYSRIEAQVGQALALFVAAVVVVALVVWRVRKHRRERGSGRQDPPSPR